MSGGLGRGTLIHDVGYLESGLQSSCESIVFGHAAIGWAKAFMRDVPTDDEALALEEIMEVGPGGNFLARKYTRRHARDFWYDDLFDHSVYDRWDAAVDRRCSTASRRGSPSCAASAPSRSTPPRRRASPRSCKPPAGARGVTDAVASPAGREGGPRAELRVWDDAACERVHDATCTRARRDRCRGTPPAGARAAAAGGRGCRRHPRPPAARARRARPGQRAAHWPLGPRARRQPRPRAHRRADMVRHRPRLPLRRRRSARPPPGAPGRRRALRGPQREAPQHRLRDVDGAARGRRRRARRPGAARRHAGRHTQADRRVEPVRRGAAARHGRDGGPLRRGRQPGLPDHVVAAPAARRELSRQAHRRRRAD